MELIPELVEVRHDTEVMSDDGHPRTPNYMDSVDVHDTEVMSDDGHPRSWFAFGKRTSPLTGTEMTTTHVTPNITLRNDIQESD